MSEHRAIIRWKRTSPDFLKGKYSREHTWSFSANVDPEEAFVASVSSCHMLTFLFVAGRQGFQVDRYDDEAVGVMTKNEKGVPWLSLVTLHPQIVYSGEKLPTPADEERLHHLAHEQCFIANSIK